MDQEESMKQASIQFRCKKITDLGTAKENDGDQDSRIESPTPDKPESRSRIKGLGSSLMKGRQLFGPEKINPEATEDMGSVELSNSVVVSSRGDDSTELPEEYERLSVLFARMDSSIRLLALRKKLPTFRNISAQVEILAKRKFLCSHLAQMKYAFPEAIQIEKLLLHDEKSLCMVPDMKVTLVHDAVPLDPDKSASATLCNAFRAKLLDFFRTHREGTDIPQAELPEPFNRENRVMSQTLPRRSTKELPQETFADLELLSSASHFSSSFHQQFSQKIITEPPAFPAPMFSVATVDENIEVLESPQINAIQFSVPSVKSHAGVIYTPSRVEHQRSESTPAKCSSTNALMTETPSLQTPRRPLTSMHKKIASGDEKPTEPKSANSVRRSLILSPSKADGSLTDPVACTSAQDEVHTYVCAETTISRSISRDEIIGTNQLHVASESAAGRSEDHNMSQAGHDKHPNSLACLLGMFDTICHILRSTDCTFITKQELVHKIILNNLDVEETGEVEEQLQLLEELVPDWISKKDISNGDCFYWQVFVSSISQKIITGLLGKKFDYSDADDSELHRFLYLLGNTWKNSQI